MYFSQKYQEKIMTKFVLLSLSLCTFMCFGVKVKMPNEQNLYQKLEKLGLEDFAETTKIIPGLANKELEATDVATGIELAIFEYRQHDDKFLKILQIIVIKKFIICLLLNDFPDAIQELKCCGLLQ
jgi:hypothetical protein